MHLSDPAVKPSHVAQKMRVRKNDHRVAVTSTRKGELIGTLACFVVVSVFLGFTATSSGPIDDIVLWILAVSIGLPFAIAVFGYDLPPSVVPMFMLTERCWNRLAEAGGAYPTISGLVFRGKVNGALDGKQLQDARLFKDSLHDGKLAFKAIFTDGTEGVYIADLNAAPPVGQATTFDVTPLFDVEATPAFPGSFILNEGGFDIDVHQRASTSTDIRGLMEFDLSSIPEDAVITDVTLTVDIWLYDSDSVNGGPLVRVFGYTGDGTPGTSDPGLTSNLLAVDDETTGLGENDISLDPSFVQNLLLSDDYLGLVMLGSTNEHKISFRTLESPFGVDPVHSITYVVPLPGDLDGDGFVGISDLNLVLSNWNQSVPPGNPLAAPSGDGFVGIEDLNAVLGNWNAGTPPNADATIPEPGSLALLCIASGLLHRRPIH